MLCAAMHILMQIGSAHETQNNAPLPYCQACCQSDVRKHLTNALLIPAVVVRVHQQRLVSYSGLVALRQSCVLCTCLSIKGMYTLTCDDMSQKKVDLHNMIPLHNFLTWVSI